MVGSRDVLMHQEAELPLRTVSAVTSGCIDCRGSMTAMMSAAAPPGAAKQSHFSVSTSTWKIGSSSLVWHTLPRELCVQMV